MTYREFLNAIVNATAIETEYMNATLEDLQSYAEAEIGKLDAANEKRRNTPTKTQVENAPLIEKIVNEVLNKETAKTASAVAAEVGISVQKASALLRGLVSEGRAVATEVKVPKKGTCKAYTLA